MKYDSISKITSFELDLKLVNTFKTEMKTIKYELFLELDAF